jgi:hypothetical protein
MESQQHNIPKSETEEAYLLYLPRDILEKIQAGYPKVVESAQRSKTGFSIEKYDLVPS